MSLKKEILMLLGAGLLSGCASYGPPYVPQHTGSLNDAENFGDVAITLRPDRSTIRRGDVIDFSVVIRNVGSEPVIVARNADVLLTWVYSDGRCDNLVRDAAREVHYDLVRLLPGEEIVRRSSLKTYYFHRGGITEFRAIVSAGGPKDAWTGRAVSNGFGVMVN